MAVVIPRQAVEDAQVAGGELWQVLLAIAGPESTWRADAIGDGGCSLGYLQMNTCGGLGAGHSRSDLLNGRYNFAAGAAYIRERLAGGAALWDALQPWSARPQAWAVLGRIRAEGIEARDGGGGGPAPFPIGDETASTVLLVGAALLLLALLARR